MSEYSIEYANFHYIASGKDTALDARTDLHTGKATGFGGFEDFLVFEIGFFHESMLSGIVVKSHTWFVPGTCKTSGNRNACNTALPGWRKVVDISEIPA